MRVGAAAGSILILATFSVVATHDFLAWSRTRWDALQTLVDHGVSPHRIDGGYEFGGSYLYDPHRAPLSDVKGWWLDDDEYRSASGPASGYAVVHVYPVARWWPAAGKDVFILHRMGGDPGPTSR